VAGAQRGAAARDPVRGADPRLDRGEGGSAQERARADLTHDTPYNTYTREGLPPTPIALPGREALLASVQPAQTGALYFVASGLGDGAHHFSETLEEHNSAVQTYLTRLRRAQRAANPPVAPGAAAGQGRRPP
jgi:UPF0755 protein